ncbi:ABC transporter permease [Micrococcales bacterium 31B]|nr:ABC transporter permease [Micrococcales bacterium 31B]
MSEPTIQPDAPGAAPQRQRFASAGATNRGALVRARRRAAAARVWREFRGHRAAMASAIFLLIVIIAAILAPVLAPSEMLEATKNLTSPRNAPPSLEHPLGTDHAGLELWARMVWGARVSLVVGISATIASVVIGTLVGMAAGHFTGWVGAVIMRIVDFFLVLPSLVLAIVLASVLSRGTLTIVIALSVASWAGTARVVRSQTLSIEARPYIERARVLGAGHWHIISRHVFPAVLPLVLANTTLTVGSAIIAESTLAFLGLGDTTQQSWGTVLKDSMNYSAAISGYWWYILVPGLAIVFVVLAFTLIGRAFETITNPTLKGR